MSSVQETHLDGDPATITALATFVRSTLAAAVSTTAQDVSTATRQSSTAWRGEAADAFGGRLATLHTSARDLTDQLPDVASWLDDLADALDESQSEMTDALAHAQTSGLVVSGTQIHRPTSVPRVGATASAEETAAVTAAHTRKVQAWNTCVDTASGALTTWANGLRLFEERCGRFTGSMATMFADFISGALRSGAIGATAYRLTAARNLHLENAARLSSHVDALTPGGVARSTPDHIYGLLDDARAARTAAQQSDDLLARGVRAGSRLSRGVQVLGFAATGYAIYDDIQQGESVEQAVVSNVGGMAAGMLAGAGAGAVVGSFIVPPAGTVVGAVVGTVVGAGVGLFTSGAIDHLYESASAGFASTVEAGWNEITGTLSDVGDLASCVWDSLFG